MSISTTRTRKLVLKGWRWPTSLTPLFFLLLFIPPSPSLKTSSSPSPLSADLSYRLTVAVLGVESVPLDESATTEPGGRCVKAVTWGCDWVMVRSLGEKMS